VSLSEKLTYFVDAMVICRLFSGKWIVFVPDLLDREGIFKFKIENSI
jgi:hypothetical protein